MATGLSPSGPFQQFIKDINDITTVSSSLPHKPQGVQTGLDGSNLLVCLNKCRTIIAVERRVCVQLDPVPGQFQTLNDGELIAHLYDCLLPSVILMN